MYGVSVSSIEVTKSDGGKDEWIKGKETRKDILTDRTEFDHCTRQSGSEFRMEFRIINASLHD